MDQTLAEQCAELVHRWREESELPADNQWQHGIVETLKDCSMELAELPEVAKVLEARRWTNNHS